jgi:acetyl esterase/lipase
VLNASGWVTLRPLSEVLPSNYAGIWVARRAMDVMLGVLSRPVPRTTYEPVNHPVVDGGRVRGEWVRAPGADSGDAVLLYVHGSGYAICSARTHRAITSRLSELTGLTVFACDYRLAPRHRFPAAADDVRAAYDWLLDQGWTPDRIVVAGDSAGGHLGVDLACELARTGEPLPAGLVAISPLYDPSLALAQAKEQEHGPDPVISVARTRKLLDLYLRDADPVHARLAVRPPAGKGWPPTLVHAGSGELLAADARALAAAVHAAGGECRLRMWPGQVHVFQMFAGLVPEAGVALDEIGEFIRERVAAAGAVEEAS